MQNRIQLACSSYVMQDELTYPWNKGIWNCQLSTSMMMETLRLIASLLFPHSKFLIQTLEGVMLCYSISFAIFKNFHKLDTVVVVQMSSSTRKKKTTTTNQN